MDKKLKISLITSIVCALLIVIGVSYSFFEYKEEGQNINLASGDISINFTNGVNYIEIPDAYPVSDKVGKIYPYYADFTVTATTLDHDIEYQIQIVPTEDTTIDLNYIKVYLTDQNDESIVEPTIYTRLNDAEYNTTGKTISSGWFEASGSQDYRLRVYIDEDYTKNVQETFGFKIYLYSKNGKAPPTLYKTVETSLASYLTEADVDGTRYVTGETVPNNYVWYSGKLWRIVAINNDGTVKLVTQNAMTAIAWSTSSSNTDYSTSQMRTWLNTEFLPTLENADTLVATSTWDYTTYSSFPTSKLTTTSTVSDKVGLLTVYDFMMTGGTNISSTSQSYLENGYYWLLLSPKSGSSVWCVYNYGNVISTSPTGAYGARPSINLMSEIQIDGGSGTESDPYRIKGDKATGQENELLNNRVSGEYINFNNTLYRIVGIENGLTKITMADYDVNKNTLSTSVNFGASSSEITFSTTYGIGKYLNDWYNATSESDTSGTYTGLYLEKTYKDMIATPADGVRWYQGPDDGIGYDYTKATQGTGIEATIGLGRYGEMFSSQFGAGYSSSTTTWLITKYSGSDVWRVNYYVYAKDTSPTNTHGARASMYLKSDVKITGGSGQKGSPYTISQ